MNLKIKYNSCHNYKRVWSLFLDDLSLMMKIRTFKFKMADEDQAYKNFLLSTKNRLLARDDVGKPKTSTVQLPGQHFSYGKPCNHDREGAGAVMSSW